MTGDATSRLPNRASDIGLVEELFRSDKHAEAEQIARRFLGDHARHSEGLIALARARFGQGDLKGAIRWADRACRLAPSSLSVASFLGALHLTAGDASAALKSIASFDLADLSAEAFVVRCRALVATGQEAEAFSVALAGLAFYPPSVVPLLGDVLGPIIRSSGHPGWFAPDIGHCLCGSLSGIPESVRLEADGLPIFDIPLPEFRQRYSTAQDKDAVVRSDDHMAFRIELLPALSDRRLALFSDGQPLAAPDLTFPRKLRVEGDAALTDDRLTGWVWLPALAGQRLSVSVTDEAGHQVTVIADEPRAILRRVNAGDGAYGFTIRLSGSGLQQGLLKVRALADGVTLENDLLTGEPVRWIEPRRAGIAARQSASDPAPGFGDGDCPEAMALHRIMPSRVPFRVPARPSAIIPPRPGTDIIIPVYRGRDETLACIRSVLETVGPDVRVIVIDDASPEAELSRDLAALAASGAITLLVNEVNLGFPKTVNRGLALSKSRALSQDRARSGGRDVVLLNSDTLVYGDWLDRLQTAAYSAADIGTVTPLSNDADILSYPSKSETASRSDDGLPMSGPDHWAALHGLASRCNDGGLVEIPTAVAFCSFIRHDCLAETGALETELFGPGYGEENDFCMRSRRLGWRHMAATDVFVAHIGGHSFGRRRLPLAARNLKALNKRHPGYDALVQRFLADNPLIIPRRQLDLARWNASPGQDARLIVTFGRSGGVARFVEDRVEKLRKAGERVLLLRTVDRHAASGSDAIRYCRIEDPDQPELRDLIFDSAGEGDLLADVLVDAGVSGIEIQHLLDHDPALYDVLTRLALPYDIFVHDYSWICPQITLTDLSGRYCGEPDLASCERCIQEKPPLLDEDITVEELRQRSARLLGGARNVVVPSQDVARRITRYTGPLPLQVTGWDDIRPVPYQPVADSDRLGGRLRVGVIGAIGPHKGFDVLLACAEDAGLRNLPLDFVLIGFSTDDAALFATGRVFVTGAYEDEELPELIRREQLNLVFLPSVCPETWSYALSNAWSAGLGVVAFGLGTIAERMGPNGGLCLPLDLLPAIINDALLAPDVSALARLLSFNPGSTTMLPTSPGFTPPQMTSGHMSPGQINASAQQLAFPPGLYCVSVTHRDGAVAAAGIVAGLPLPSIQIAALPGDGEAIRIVGDRDGWLCRPGDALVVHISGDAPRSLLLTSYQQASLAGRALDIQISRLDSPAAAAEQSALTAPRPRVRLDIVTHVQNVGDVSAPLGAWAGSPEQRNWVEAFIITPVEGLPANAIEYKALNNTGFETPWISGGNLCGSRGQNSPLTGMAIRLTGSYAERFECAYEILYLSGTRSPSLSNGQPHRSDRVGDPIQAFVLRITERAAYRA